MSRPTPPTPPRRSFRTRFALAAALCAGLVACGAGEDGPAESATPVTQAAEPTTDRLVVQYLRGTEGARRRALSATSATATTLQRQGLTVLTQHRNAMGAHVLHLAREERVSDLQALAARLKAEDPTIEFAEPDLRMQTASVPNDPLYPQQWHYFNPAGGLNLPSAWDLADGQGVVVAVIDTGVRPHPDLADNLLTGYDFVSSPTMSHDGDGRDSDANDPGDGCSNGRSTWHGTHVAGTIAAVSNNNLGVAGVAPAAKILPVRVLGCGGGYMSDIADGVVWASGGTVAGVTDNPQPARVLNLSLGGGGTCSSTMQAAIDGARSRGSVLVIAAGNSNTAAGTSTPANCRGVVVVAATGPAGAKAPYSNYGGIVDVAAPGGNMSRGTSWGVLSTHNDGGASPGNDNYGFLQGTSMATPHVAGVAALMLSRHPGLTPDEVETLLKSTARAFPIACSGCGTGIVNAARAVGAVFLGAVQATDVTETEPNHTMLQAQVLSGFPLRVVGRIETAQDIDHFKVNAGVGATITARLIGNPAANLDLALRGPMGTVRVSSARPAGLADVVTFRNPNATATDFYLRVTRVSGGIGANASYTLEVKVE